MREFSRTFYGEMRCRDTHVRFAAELARQGAALFDRLWCHARPPHVSALPDDASEVDALLVPNSSQRCKRHLACLHAGLINRASRQVYVTTPYFSPRTVVADALCGAAGRGVDVRLLVPRVSNPRISGWTTRAAYAPLLAAGVRIFEYLPRELHAKTSVIDGAWATIGSANLDYLSLFVNQELVLIARDRQLGGKLRDQYLDDLADAAEIRSPTWGQRSRGERCLEAIGRAARRLV